ncbi:MAG TPA: peroxiredoxin [Hyphomicrobiales bacterium]|nr:peroxiredoxin [Rhodobiaceae bacterium]HXK54566.1 peroxiredoxin [Hyphomicrobiales bacterium]
MHLQIGDRAPDFKADTTQGPISFHKWMGNSWCILFSHPKDFTPVCTTELGHMARLKHEFDKRNVRILGHSVDPVAFHIEWAKDIEESQGFAPNFPIVGDPDLVVARRYGMIPRAAKGKVRDRTARDNQSVRTMFIIGPDKKIKAMLTYPMSTGRNFDEVLRVVDSLQLTAAYQVATPANWKQGEDVIIIGALSDVEAKARFPQGWNAPKPYIRIVHAPH